MSVNNRIHVAPFLIDGQMHLNFARGIVSALQLSSGEIDDDHVLRLHHPLAEAGRADHDAALLQPNLKIAIAGSDESVPVKQSAEATQLVPGAVLTA